MDNNVIENGAVYQAKIVDQIVSRNRHDELQVVFTTEVSGKLTNERDPNCPVESVGTFERDVYLTFSGEEQRLRMALDHLKRLGFDESDVVKLHPDHPESVSMVGKEVRVRPKIIADVAYWNFAWSGWRPAALKLEEAQPTATQLKRKIELMRGNSTDSRPPVSY